ncbi:hypothetical protein Tco_1492390 [Tanacetum coccineum]
MVPPNMLGPDLNGIAINETQYRGVIGSLMCLTESRPDIQVSLISVKDIKQILRNPILLLLRELFIKSHTLKEDMEFHFIPTQYQLANIFIKLLDKPSFKRLINELEPFTRSPNMYKEYISEFWNAIGAHYLPHSREYVAPPYIDIVRPWFEIIRNGEIRPVKGTLKKSLLPPKWRLLMAQIIQCFGGKTGGFDQITNNDAIILYSIANGINIDYASIFWEDIIIKQNKRNREKIVPYTRFLSLLMMHKMKEGYGDALKPSSKAERVPQGTKPGAKLGHKNHSTSSKQPSVSSKEATKDGSSKASTGSKTGHLKRKKEFSSAINWWPTSLGVTSEARANPPISSGMSVFNLNEPIYSASFIIHSEYASGNEASAVSTAEVDPGKSAPSGTDLHVLADKTQYVSEGLETVLTQPITGKGASSIARQVEEDEASKTVKLEDLAKLVSSVQPSIKDLDSPKDDPIIVVDDSDEDEEAEEVHDTTNVEIKDTSVPKSLSPKSSQIQELTKQLLVKSLQTELLKILSAHDFSSSLPTELKDLPSKFNELTKEVKGLKKQVHELEIKLVGDLKEIPTKLEDFTKTVTSLTSQVAELKTLQWELPAEFLSQPVKDASVQAKLKILDALPSLLLNVIKALYMFAQVLDSALSKAGDQSVPSAGQANTMSTEGEKNINQANISQLFQRRTEKNAEKENLTKSKPTPPPTTPIIPLVITTTTIQMQSLFFHNPTKNSSQPKGEHTKKDKVKNALL